jgi:hypothetical protein
VPDSERRATLDAAGQQVGEQHVAAAGGNINHGADATEVLAFLREYVTKSDQQRETVLKTISRELAHTRLDSGIISDAVRSVRDRLDDDDRDRARRQAELDGALTSLGETLEAQDIVLAALRRAQYRLAWAVVALALLWLLGFLALALLIYDRYAALSLLRAWLGAGLALAFSTLRP